MPAKKNEFKRQLTDSNTLFGCWIGMVDGYAAEISATAGFDWLVIDGEHAPNSIPSIVRQLQVIGASDSHPIVRLPNDDAYMIKQALDIGAQSLLIPMVESAAQAAALVKATRYPPNGIRGVGAALTRSSEFNAIPDYLTTADDQICLIVQIESKAGVDALEDILAVDGVDAAFIGPSDLAADMGLLGQPDCPEVQELTNSVLKRIRATGKAAGILALNQASIQHAIDSGANFIGVGIDVLLFASSMRKLAASPTNPE